MTTLEVEKTKEESKTGSNKMSPKGDKGTSGRSQTQTKNSATTFSMSHYIFARKSRRFNDIYDNLMSILMLRV